MSFNIKIPFVIASHVKKFTATSAFKDKSKAAAIGAIGGRLFFNNGGAVLPVAAVSAPLVVSAATLTLDPLLHSGLTVVLTSLTGCVITLPAATGTGNRYRVIVGVAPTSGSIVAAVASATDFMRGFAYTSQDAGGAGVTWATANTGTLATESDTMTWNRTTTGIGSIGDAFELQDIASAVWSIYTEQNSNGTEATPFSAAV